MLEGSVFQLCNDNMERRRTGTGDGAPAAAWSERKRAQRTIQRRSLRNLKAGTSVVSRLKLGQCVRIPFVLLATGSSREGLRLGASSTRQIRSESSLGHQGNLYACSTEVPFWRYHEGESIAADLHGTCQIHLGRANCVLRTS